MSRGFLVTGRCTLVLATAALWSATCAWGAEPASIDLESRSIREPIITWSPGSSIPIYEGEVRYDRYWAVDPEGNRIPAARFASLVGDPETAEQVTRYREEIRTPTRIALLGGLAAWGAGGLLLFAGAETDVEALSWIGLPVLVVGQVSTVWGIATPLTRQARSRRLDPWYSQREAWDLAAAYNER